MQAQRFKRSVQVSRARGSTYSKFSCVVGSTFPRLVTGDFFVRTILLLPPSNRYPRAAITLRIPVNWIEINFNIRGRRAGCW